MNVTNFKDLMLAIEDEYKKARANNSKPLNSAHEGYAVLLEEVDELWEEVRKKKSERSKKRMEEECIQVAAMAIKFVVDVCTEVPASCNHTSKQYQHGLDGVLYEVCLDCDTQRAVDCGGAGNKKETVDAKRC